MAQDIIAKIYNSFHPFIPLKPGDPAYVQCSEVRGDENIFNEIGKKIVRSDQFTCQLYTGHRGGGKSTELLRLKEYLEKNACFVVYFGATDGDIDEQDAEYTDILLGCTRHILEQLKAYANPHPLLEWLKLRWKSLKDLLGSDYEFADLSFEQQIAAFTKLTASIRRIPSQREAIRKQVDIHSVSLIEALNEFIEEAARNLPDNKSKLVVIVDNLDRIPPIYRNNGKVNHDEIFITYSTQLTALNCHVIYTVPISLVYSNQATELRNIYDTPQVLPMIMIKDKNNQVYPKGMDKLGEMITRRLSLHTVEADFDFNRYDLGVFDNIETRLKLCRMTGGHVRELMLFMQTAIDYIDNLPITQKAVNYAINEARDNTYRNAVDSHEWEKLVIVSESKNIPNEEEYRSLLFRRCVLEYRAMTETGDIKRWYDIHPLIEDIDEFKSAK